MEEKIELIRNYRSQPIDTWESMIRQRAAQPPVERRWAIWNCPVFEKLKS